MQQKGANRLRASAAMNISTAKAKTPLQPRCKLCCTITPSTNGGSAAISGVVVVVPFSPHWVVAARARRRVPARPREVCSRTRRERSCMVLQTAHFPPTAGGGEPFYVYEFTLAKPTVITFSEGYLRQNRAQGCE